MTAVDAVATDEMTAHLAQTRAAIDGLRYEVQRIERWGGEVADVLLRGGRVLACGNGGSAAEAQHLTGELVGRYRADRAPFSAIALHGDSSALTAIVNDYGADQAFARQVHAHGRRGDVLVALSTSGHSLNVVAAVDQAHRVGMRTYGLCGASASPLADGCDEAICIAGSAAAVQEAHLVIVHLLCTAFEAAVASRARW